MSEHDFGGELKIPKLRIPRGSAGMLRAVVIGFFGLILIFSSFYTIGPEEIGVVLRLGKFQRSTDPGLHFRLPLGIERLVTNIRKQRAERYNNDEAVEYLVVEQS